LSVTIEELEIRSLGIASKSAQRADFCAEKSKKYVKEIKKSFKKVLD